MAAIAAKESYAQVFLKRLHLHAGGARRKTERVGTAREALVLRNGYEHSQTGERGSSVRRARR